MGFNPYILDIEGPIFYPEVDYFADLPDPAQHAGEIYIVRFASGVYLINRKEAGAYRSNGVTWEYLGNLEITTDEVAEASNLYFTDARARAAVNFAPQQGRFTITQNITSLSTYEYNAALNDSDYTRGRLWLQSNNATTLGAGCVIDFTTDINDGCGLGAYVYSITVGSYYFMEIPCLVRTYRMDSKVSDRFLGPYSVSSGAIAPISVDSVRLDGAQIEIIFRNNISGTQSLQVDGQYWVFRGDRDTTP